MCAILYYILALRFAIGFVIFDVEIFLNEIKYVVSED